MPVYPPEWHPINKSGRYPHMARHDAVIWERWVDQFATGWQSCTYDMALGGVVMPAVDGDERTALMFRYATAMKIDVVIVNLSICLVCEVKPHAGASAVGQALCYARMLEADGATHLAIVPAIITDYCNPDVKYCCEQFGVYVFEVGGHLTLDGAARPATPSA